MLQLPLAAAMADRLRWTLVPQKRELTAQASSQTVTATLLPHYAWEAHYTYQAPQFRGLIQGVSQLHSISNSE